MTEFDPAALDWTSGLLAGWAYDKPVNKWFQGQFRSVHRLTRTCPTCAEVIVLDVTVKALQDKATNHGLALRRCKKCRAALKQSPNEYAERKALGTTNVAAEPAASVAIPAQIVVHGIDPKEHAEVKAERDEYAEGVANQMTENGKLRREIETLKTRLAKYELAPAMAAVQPKPVNLPPEPLTMAQSTATLKPHDPAGQQLLQKFLESKKKMPWDS